jgi:hypothetical protein
MDLRGNLLSGTLPAVIGTFQLMTKLLLVSGVPSVVSRMGVGLGYVCAGKGGGECWRVFHTLNHYSTHAQEDNHLSGSIPSTLGNMYRLLNVELGDNKFTGALPSLCCSSCSCRMKELTIKDNQFSGLLSGVDQLTELLDLEAVSAPSPVVFARGCFG